jgi:hypothetical protein
VGQSVAPLSEKILYIYIKFLFTCRTFICNIAYRKKNGDVKKFAQKYAQKGYCQKLAVWIIQVQIVSGKARSKSRKYSHGINSRKGLTTVHDYK